MNTLDEYLNAAPEQQDQERARRGWKPRPPIVHSHRKPGPVTAQQIRENRKRDAARATLPTHYGTPRPMLDELRLNNLTAGRTHE